MFVPLSLTLTLSRWEREQLPAVFRFVSDRSANPVARILVRLRAILPLPAGEGRGEGEEPRKLSDVGPFMTSNLVYTLPD